MPNDNRLPLLEELPDEILYLIKSYLPKAIELYPLCLSSRRFYCLFQDVMIERRLLESISNADYKSTKEVLRINAEIMFKKVEIYDIDGTQVISPLKYACKLLDIHMLEIMWMAFKTANQNNPDPKYAKRFLQHIDEQEEHINIEPLFEAYKVFARQKQRWLNNEIDETELNQHWREKFGGAQAMFAPIWMLKEFCRKGDSWKVDSKFDDAEPPSYCKALYDNEKDPKRNGEISVLPPNLNSGLGKDYALFRALEKFAIATQDAPSFLRVDVEKDELIFRHLYNVRLDNLKQFKKRVEEFTPEPKAKRSIHF